MATGVVVEKF